MNRQYPSDLDAAEAVSGIPESEIRARDEEREREQRHAKFVKWLKKEYRVDSSWVDIVHDAAAAVEGDITGECMEDFIASDGVPALFAALSRAMREVEVERENLLDRR